MPWRVACSLQVLAAGEDRVERRLLQCGPDRRSYPRALVHDVMACHPRAAARRRQERREHQNRRRLARAVGAEEAVDLAGSDLEVDAVDRAWSFAELTRELFNLDCRPGGGHPAHDDNSGGLVPRQIQPGPDTLCAGGAIHMAATQSETHTRAAVGAATIAEAFRITAAERASDVAIRTKGDAFTITWGELRERVDALAGGLAGARA